MRVALRSLSIFAELLFLGLVGAVVWQAQKTSLRNETLYLRNLFLPWLEKITDVTEAFAPGPLNGPLSPAPATLTTAGILRETNRHRAINDVPPLLPNATLDRAAEKKVADMFARQYFAHEAPDGTGPGDLVTSVKYEFIRVGEN